MNPVTPEPPRGEIDRQLCDLIDRLRLSGFSIGLDQYIAAHKLLIFLAGNESLPEDPREWRGLLAPILCASRQQQEAFKGFFDLWVSDLEGPKIEPPDNTFKQIVVPDKTPDKRPDGREGRKVVAMKIGVSGLAVALLIAVLSLFTNLWVPAAVILAGTVALIWWRVRAWLLKGAVLGRQSVRGPVDLQRISLRGDAGLLFGAEVLRKSVRLLRRPRPIGAADLDIAATIDSSIRHQGLVTPVYRLRRATPSYLFLIERTYPGDVQARFGDELADRLSESLVSIEKFYFSGDLSSVEPVDFNKPFVPIQDLVSRYPDHRVFIFADGSSLFSPVTGEPYPWLSLIRHWRHCTLLTPEMTNGYHETVLAGYNLRILPLTLKGLGGLPEEVDPDALITFDARTQPMPTLILDQPNRWIETSPVDEERIGRLFSQLRSYLGDHGWLWLRACAVFPLISWEITITLGVRRIGRVGDFHALLLALVRLPWFRHGQMPDWLRWRLIDSLTSKEEEEIRQIIFDMLSQIDEKGGIDLDIAQSVEPSVKNIIARLRQRLDAWIRLRSLSALLDQQPDDSPLRDVLMVSFLAGKKTRRLSVGLTDLLRQMLTGGDRVRFGWHNLREWFELLAERRRSRLLEVETTIPAQPSAEPIILSESAPPKVVTDGDGLPAPTGRALSVETIELTGGVRLEMVNLTGGEFTMGGDSFDDEKPRHRVHLSPFAIGKYQVTQAQWKAVMGSDNNPSTYKGDDRPVETVSWDDVVGFIERLNRQVKGARFRLPTEAEWEYAARAGSTTEYCYGDDPELLDQYAWYNHNSNRETHPVGGKRPNQFGLYDVHGNVWEWCGDWFDSDYYAECRAEGTVVDPTGPGRGSIRVFRGGGWRLDAVYCRSARRIWSVPGHRHDDLGFRLVRIGR